MTIHTVNLETWLTTLRSGKYQQGAGKLATPDGLYCCLGVGCELAGVSRQVYDDGDSEGVVYYGQAAVSELAPMEFFDWLGVSLRRVEAESDLYIDIPRDHPGFLDSDGDCTVQWSCAGLNDSGFTFPQIADVVAYFGIRGTE